MSDIRGNPERYLRVSSSQFDPNVWSGRASQEGFAELVVSGLASIYPTFDWSVSCSEQAPRDFRGGKFLVHHQGFLTNSR